MLTRMTEADWSVVLDVFDAAQSRSGEPGNNDRKFLEALHYFTVHSITWRALPAEFGNWNSIWKRFWRLSRSGVWQCYRILAQECWPILAHPPLAAVTAAMTAGATRSFQSRIAS